MRGFLGLVLMAVMAASVAAAAAKRGARAPASAPRQAAAGLSSGTRDLVVRPVVQVLPMPEGTPAGNTAAYDWSAGRLRVTGRGRPSTKATSNAQRRWTAREAALIVATRNLGLALRGIPVSSEETLARYVERQGGKLEFHFQVRMGQVVKERALEEGDFEVTMEASFSAVESLGGVVGPDASGAAPAKASPRLRAEGWKPPAGLTPTGADGPFTGLVLVATDLKAEPVLRPLVLSEEGRALYGPGIAEGASARAQGLASYAYTLSDARALGRAGEKPLVVAASGVDARNAGCLFLSKGDAERVRAADKRNGFLKKAAVVVILDPDS
ncbi:MAG: hypothetical protein HY321_12480 [Armatimonadetes bacterium]|nr:hypothetical protein [Armatimonadota bacterium]